MSFAGLHYFWIFIFSILSLVIGYYFQQLKQKELSNWIKKDFWDLIIPEFSKKKFLTKWILFSVGLIFVLFSLMRPQWGEHEETIESKGMDLMFILDLSNSMLSEDVNPSRLNRSQLFIKKTLSQLADDRVGVVGFAGRAFLAIPLTTDFGYVSEVVDSLNPSAIADQGTEIGEAIDVAIKAFERGGSDNRKTSRAIILISDGEDFGKDASKVASKVKDFGTGFFSFSVGTPEGAPIPIRNEVGILQTYKKDRASKTILSKPNPELLSKIAANAGGKFFELTNVDDASYLLVKQLLSFHRESTKEQRQISKIDRYQIFLSVGLILIILSFFIGYSKLFKKGLFLLIVFISTSASAQTLEGYWKNKRGIKHFDDKNFEESAKTFEEARGKDSDNPVIEFNQATALANAKKNEDAIFHYEESTKKSLNQGDFETAAKSLFNEGLIHKESKNYPDAFQKLTNAIEMAKISNQPELEKKAREALLQSSQEQQEKKKQEEKGDSKEPKDPKDSKEQKQKEQDQKDGKEQKDPNSDQKKNQSMDDGKKREFKSGTLSKDVAEGIMNDLSDREKQLYQHKMKEKKARESQNEKDW